MRILKYESLSQEQKDWMECCWREKYSKYITCFDKMPAGYQLDSLSKAIKAGPKALELKNKISEVIKLYDDIEFDNKELRNWIGRIPLIASGEFCKSIDEMDDFVKFSYATPEGLEEHSENFKERMAQWVDSIEKKLIRENANDIKVKDVERFKEIGEQWVKIAYDAIDKVFKENSSKIGMSKVKDDLINKVL